MTSSTRRRTQVYMYAPRQLEAVREIFAFDGAEVSLPFCLVATPTACEARSPCLEASRGDCMSGPTLA